MKQMLTQVTMAFTDAVSLPWPAVRVAWVTLMTQIEEGRLSWTNETQRALNRIGTSQVTVMNCLSINNQQVVRVCKFFNEGSCSHDFNNGNYKHICSACNKKWTFSASSRK